MSGHASEFDGSALLIVNGHREAARRNELNTIGWLALTEKKLALLQLVTIQVSLEANSVGLHTNF